MKIVTGEFDDRYIAPGREHHMPLNVQITGTTRPSPKYYTDIVATDYEEGCYQMEYVMGGKGYIVIEDKITPVTEGDFFFINNHVHRIVYADREDPFRKIYVCVSGEFMKGLVSAYQMDVPLVVVKVDVQEHLQKILQIAKQAQAFSPDVLDLIGDEILQIVRKVYYANTEIKHMPCKKNIAESIMLYIQLNYTRKLTIEELTERFYLCKTQLIKQFKNHYGTTPMKYVITKRIQASMHYLKDTDLPIADIYGLVGFSDAKYFSQTFKTHTGLTPSEFRHGVKSHNA